MSIILAVAVVAGLLAFAVSYTVANKVVTQYVLWTQRREFARYWESAGTVQRGHLR